MATTLCLLAVFLPVGFMGGIVGRFMSSFGFTSAFAIAVSLLVSFTLTPMLCSRFIKRPEHARQPGQHSSKDSFIFKYIDIYYTRMLTWSMAHRGVVVALSVGVILSIVPLFMFVGKNFLPQDDQSQYNVLIRTPEGTSIAATTNLAERIAQDVRGLPGVAHTLMTAGGSADKSVNNAAIYVKLTDIDQRADHPAAAHAAHPRPDEEVPAGDSHRRGTGQLGGRQSEQRRNPVLHPGPGPAEARHIFRRRCSQK